jgi:hypothetical protein
MFPPDCVIAVVPGLGTTIFGVPMVATIAVLSILDKIADAWILSEVGINLLCRQTKA